MSFHQNKNFFPAFIFLHLCVRKKSAIFTIFCSLFPSHIYFLSSSSCLIEEENYLCSTFYCYECIQLFLLLCYHLPRINCRKEKKLKIFKNSFFFNGKREVRAFIIRIMLHFCLNFPLLDHHHTAFECTF